MQVTEITNEGLKREFAILVPRADLDSKVDGKLSEIKDKVQLKGFRPGKAPLPLLKAKQALNRLPADSYLEVVATDPGSDRPGVGPRGRMHEACLCRRHR